MSFQSILPKEGWKSQKVVYFAKGLCHNCLSRKIFTPALPHARITTNVMTSLPQQTKGVVTRAYSTLTENIASTTTPPFYERLQEFHNELYHPQTPPSSTVDNSTSASATATPSSQEYQSETVRITVARRLARKKLHDLYRQLTPLELKQLTRKDVDTMVTRFCTNPDDPTSARAAFEGIEILQDVKARKIPNVEFLVEDCERMVQFASELKLTDKAERWALYIESHFNKKPSKESLERLFAMLSAQGKQKRLDYWSKKYTPTRSMLKSSVLCLLKLGQMDQATELLKSTCESELIDAELNEMVSRYAESHELMEHVLDAFGIEAIKGWRMNEARLIYNQKHNYGLGTRTILKNLINKCFYTGQINTMEQTLNDAIRLNDISSAQYCANTILRWYMKKKNVKHAVAIWELLERNNVPIQKGIFSELIFYSAKAKYHVDTMRLYRRYKELYPVTPPEMRVRVMRCLLRSRQFEQARSMCDDITAQLKYMKTPLAKLASRSLYSLCAQTGDTELFETVFRVSEELGYNTTHEALTSLIACYLTANNVPGAKAAFQSVASHTNGPDVVDFNLLMRTVVAEEKNVNYDKVLDILSHMKMVGVSTDISTLRTMLSFYPPKSPMRDELYSKLLKFPKATQADHIYLNNIALSNLLKLKPVDQVAHILTVADDRGCLFPSEKGKHIVRDDLSYQILIDATCKQPKYTYITLNLYKDMRARGFKPSVRTFEYIINSLAMSGRIKKARGIIYDMERDTGVKSNIGTWTKLVDGLLSINKPEAAKEIITHEMAIRNFKLDSLVVERLNKIESLLAKK
ncbi:hypothetical protein K501DRAFT_322146 [Backusella circina FSU 941]|nr:hypothetical protein K501DRAFT_322146 [Backusella circina FSU 941]